MYIILSKWWSFGFFIVVAFECRLPDLPLGGLSRLHRPFLSPGRWIPTSTGHLWRVETERAFWSSQVTYPGWPNTWRTRMGRANAHAGAGLVHKRECKRNNSQPHTGVKGRGQWATDGICLTSLRNRCFSHGDGSEDVHAWKGWGGGCRLEPRRPLSSR